MKRFSTIALKLLLVVAFSLPASASAATNPGIKPGSFFYFFDTTFEKIGLFFTFSPEKKAEKALEYAEERLAEAEAVTDNAEAVKTAITSYESNIAFATEKSKEVGEKEKVEALLTSIADNTSKHQEVLTNVLAKVPDEAKGAITRAIEASRKGHDEAMQKIAELKGEVEELKQEVAELKVKDEEREKVIEELGKSKSETAPKQAPTPTATKPATPQISETTAPKQNTAQPSTPQKMDEPKKTEATVQPPTTTTPAPESAPTQTPTTQTQSSVAVQISSVSVTPSLTSAQIEWQTNIPTSAKIFLSGGNLSSKVYSSESGLSTRHIVNAAGLAGGTTYSYEIESIAGDQVAKKGGSFSTIDKSDILIKSTTSGQSEYGRQREHNFLAGQPGTVLLTTYGEYDFSVSVLDKSGNYLKDVSIQMDVPMDDLYNIVYRNTYPYHTRTPNGITNNLLNDWSAPFSYNPTSTGTKIITFTATSAAGTLSKSITIEVK